MNPTKTIFNVFLAKVINVLLFPRLRRSINGFRNLTDLCTTTRDIKTMSIVIRYVPNHYKLTKTLLRVKSLGVVVHAFNPSVQEVELSARPAWSTEQSKFQDSKGYTVRPCL